MSQITTKPPHKEKFHVLWFNRARTGTSIDDCSMEDTDYLPRPIGKFGLGLESTKNPSCSKEFDRIAVLGLDMKIRAQAEITEDLEAPS